MQAKLDLKGYWIADGLDAQGHLLWQEAIYNDVVSAALTDLLSVYFASGTQKPSWYAGLIDNAAYTGVALADTISSHAGWAESTAYSESTRPQWTPTVSGGLASNATVILFTMSAATSLRGLFLVSNSTKGGSTGTLWSTALFTTVRAMLTLQTLRLTYRLRAAGGG